MDRKHYVDLTKKNILEDGSIEYKGYVFHKEGYVTNKSGKKIEISAKTGRMRLNLDNGKMITIKTVRIAYELYHEVTLERSQIVACLDGDLKNIAKENLVLLDRKEYFKDFNWTYKFDEETVEKIKEEYSQGNISMQKLADKYGCCLATVFNIIQGNYKGTKITK